MTHDDYRDLLAPYALGALEPVDELECLTHLDSCAECRREVEAFKHVTQRLGEGAGEVAPPASLRSRLMAEVGRTPQDPGLSAPPAVAPPNVPTQRKSPVAALLAGAMALAVAGLLGWNMTLQGDLKDTQEHLAQSSVVSDLVMNHATKTAALVAPDGSSHGSALVEGARSAVIAEDLPDLGKDSQYVVWVKSSKSEMVAVAAFDVDARGKAVVPIALPEGTVQGVYLSAEPRSEALPSTPTRTVAGGDLRET